MHYFYNLLPGYDFDYHFIYFHFLSTFTASTMQCFKSFGQTGFASGNIWTVLKSSRKLTMTWKNPDIFETIRKINNNMEKSGQYWNCPENCQWSGTIRTILKLSGKLVMIWENPDSFETLRKIDNYLEKSGVFWNRPYNWQSSGNRPENWQLSG